MWNHAGIELNLGKTKVWNRAGREPPQMHEIGEDAWSPNGVIMLGSPVGNAGFIASFVHKRIQDEKKLLEALQWMSDPQCTWQVLSTCAVPRANYIARILPPSASATYAAERDDVVWAAAL